MKTSATSTEDRLKAIWDAKPEMRRSEKLKAIESDESTVEEKVLFFIGLGHDFSQAQNLATGKPEWFQNIVDTGPDYTKSAEYLATQAVNRTIVRPQGAVLAELERELDNVTDLIDYWKVRVLDDAQGKLVKFRAKQTAAREVAAELGVVTDRPLNSEERFHLNRANEILERMDFAIKQQEARASNATAQIALNEERGRRIDMPLLRKLRKESNLRDKMNQ